MFPSHVSLDSYQLYLSLRLALFLMTLALLRSHGQVFCSMSHYYNFSDVLFSDYTVCIDLGKEDTEVMCCFHHHNLGSPFCLTEHTLPSRNPISFFTGIFPESNQSTTPHNYPGPCCHHLSLG